MPTTDRMDSRTLTRFRLEGRGAAAMEYAGRHVLAEHGLDAADSAWAWRRFHPDSPIDARLAAAWRKAYRAEYAELIARDA